MSKQQQAPGELELVRSFVNTVDLEEGVEELSSPDALVVWLAGNQLAARELKASRADLTRATELREALRAVLFAHNGGAPASASAVQTLDRVADRAALRLRFREDSTAGARARRRRRRWGARTNPRDRPRFDRSGNLDPTEGVSRAQLRVGLLRSHQEPLGRLVQHGRVRKSREGAFVP